VLRKLRTPDGFLGGMRQLRVDMRLSVIVKEGLLALVEIVR
jgi:hypothetical protein